MLDTPMQQIELAREGRYGLINDVIGAVFGKGDGKPGKPNVEALEGAIPMKHGAAIAAMFASRFGARVEYRKAGDRG